MEAGDNNPRSVAASPALKALDEYERRPKRGIRAFEPHSALAGLVILLFVAWAWGTNRTLGTFAVYFTSVVMAVDGVARRRAARRMDLIVDALRELHAGSHRDAASEQATES
jgi:hypothetical protein